VLGGRSSILLDGFPLPYAATICHLGCETISHLSVHPLSPALSPQPLREASLASISVLSEGAPHERHTSCHMVIIIDHIDGTGSLRRPLLSANTGANGPARIHRIERRLKSMSTYPQVHVRMETICPPFTIVTIDMNEDSFAKIASQLDLLERLIARYGAHAFFGEPQTEPPRQTA
jgi:hypothetical protein